MSSRIAAIFNLCLLFWMVAWYMGYPFLKEHSEYKDRTSVYKYVMGLDEDPDRSKLMKNLFLQIPDEKQLQLIDDYEHWKSQFHRGWALKALDGTYILSFALPAFLRTWLFFSLIVSLMVLYRSVHTREVIWILPLLALLLATDNYHFARSTPKPLDAHLFPSEEYIVTHYIDDQRLSGGMSNQFAQLKEAWNRYLVTEWLKEKPVKEEQAYKNQVLRGDHAFQVERLLHLGKAGTLGEFNRFKEKYSPLFIFFFLAWNVVFAGIVAFDKEFNKI